MREPPLEYGESGQPDAAGSGPGPAPIHDVPTLIERKRPGGARRVTTPPSLERSSATGGPDSGAEQSSRASTTASPVQAMWLDELARTRIFLKVIVGLTLSCYACFPFLDGDPRARRIFFGGVTLALTAAAWLLHDLRKQENYNLTRLLVGGVLMGTCAWTGVFFFGVFSPAPGIFVLGLYYFSLGAATTVTLVVYFVVAGLQLASAIAIQLGYITDPGLITAANLSVAQRSAIQFLVQMLLLSAYVMARLQRRNTLQAVERLERAVRQVSHREALLREARHDLDRALRVGGAGRFSDVTVGSFELGTLIGRGGMGEVYDAVHVTTRDEAAVKLLSAHALGNPELVTRFLREAELAASLECPHVVRVLEVGRAPGEIPYLAMERLRGRDLAHHLRNRRRLAAGRVITMVEQVGRGLEAARAAGIVHRDLKPQNLFCAEQPARDEAVWKILDFGVSKLADQGGTLTRGAVVGTPGYMAPEQARGENVDYRADLYSLAVIAYRAITGHPAFSGRDLPSTLYDVVYKMPVRPTQLCNLPPEVDLVLAIGMAKDPELRWENGEEFATALRAAARGELSAHYRARARDLLAVDPWSESVGRIS